MRFFTIPLVCLGMLFQSSHHEPAQISFATEKPASSATLLPTRLEIPAIKLIAMVDKVGLLPNHSMDVPKTFDRVGLLYPGFLPGQNGNAVIDGHLDHYTGPAVFFYLKRLKRGDKLILSDDSRSSLTFVVKSVEAFKTKEAPLNRIFGPAGSPRLNLVTCTGRFDRKKHEHEERLVVFTELEGQSISDKKALVSH